MVGATRFVAPDNNSQRVAHADAGSRRARSMSATVSGKRPSVPAPVTAALEASEPSPGTHSDASVSVIPDLTGPRLLNATVNNTTRAATALQHKALTGATGALPTTGASPQRSSFTTRTLSAVATVGTALNAVALAHESIATFESLGRHERTRSEARGIIERADDVVRACVDAIEQLDATTARLQSRLNEVEQQGRARAGGRGRTDNNQDVAGLRDAIQTLRTSRESMRMHAYHALLREADARNALEQSARQIWSHSVPAVGHVAFVSADVAALAGGVLAGAVSAGIGCGVWGLWSTYNALDAEGKGRVARAQLERTKQLTASPSTAVRILGAYENARWSQEIDALRRQATCCAIAAAGNATLAGSTAAVAAGALCGGAASLPGLVFGAFGAGLVLSSWLADGVWRLVHADPSLNDRPPTPEQVLIACQDDEVLETLASYTGLSRQEVLWALEVAPRELVRHSGLVLDLSFCQRAPQEASRSGGPLGSGPAS